MAPIRWTNHALESLVDRDLPREVAEQTLRDPEFRVSGHSGRTVFARLYHDEELGQEMLMCVVTEERGDETIGVTVYRTSKIGKSLRGEGS